MSGLISSDLWSPGGVARRTGALFKSERDAATRDFMATEVDDKSLRYLVDVHPAFAALRTTAGQLAGMLTLIAAGAKAGVADPALLNAASLSYAEASDKLRSLTVSDRVRHLHHHLQEAAEGIGRALKAAEKQMHSAGGEFDVTEVLSPLRLGYKQLQFASQLAPGFRLVNISQACCGGAR